MLVDTEQHQPQRQLNPETQAGILARIYFLWISPLINIANQRMIDPHTDLFHLHHHDTAHTITRQFLHILADSNSMIHAMLRYGKSLLIASGIFMAIHSICLIINPLLLRGVVTAVNDGDRNGYYYAGALGISILTSTLANQAHFHLAYRLGQRLRSVVIAVTYEHALSMKESSFSQVSKGEVMNILANDSQKFFELMPLVHLLWAAPIMVISCVSLLIYFLGISALPGIAFVLFLAPLNYFIALWQKRVRKSHLPAADKRLQMCNEVLNGIRVVKYFSWEEKFQQSINELRNEELRFINSELNAWATSIFFIIIFPVVSTIATFASYVKFEGDLNPSDTFVALALFQALKFPLTYSGQAVSLGIQTYISVGRLSAFLLNGAQSSDLKNVMDDSKVVLEEPEDDVLIEMDKASFHWSTVGGFKLNDITFKAGRGDVIAIVGEVGAGKTMLAMSVIAELIHLDGVFRRRGTVAYASQEPYILNTTVRENILLGNSFEEEKYRHVVDACQLWPDFAQWTYSDLTLIGERGVTLSGGQKARISLARAVYSMADIIILDDPLSAVDAHTGRKIFDEVLSENGLLKSSCVLLITHAVQYLSQVDQLLVLQEGNLLFKGNYNELIEAANAEHDHPVIQQIVESAQEVSEDIDEKKELFLNDSIENIPKKLGKVAQEFMTAEKTEQESLSWRIIWRYIKECGGWVFILVFGGAMFLERLSFVAADWWLAVWSSPESSSRLQEAIGAIGLSNDQHIIGYFLISVVNAIFAFTRLRYICFAGQRAAARLFRDLLGSVLKSPMVFFETTPMGRILNRFSYDVEIMDFILITFILFTIASLFWIMTALAVMGLVTPFSMIVIIPVCMMFIYTQKYFRRCNIQLQRLEANSRSPIQAHFSETLLGTATIRAFNLVNDFVSKNERLLDMNNRVLFVFVANQRWLAVRLGTLGALVTTSVAFSAVYTSDTLTGGLAGLAIIWSFNMTATLDFLSNYSAQLEAKMNSIERIVSYVDTLGMEEDCERKDAFVPHDWPSKGEIRFENVVMRYREDLEPALRGLSFSIIPGERVAIVGRTGAGKSSVAVTLFRQREIEEGSILIDGVDLSTIALKDLRGNHICIIPQDPVLFSGTIRENLDPFYEYSDEEVWNALRHSRIDKFVESQDSSLNEIVADGGSNLSVGQRQLLCLARTLLRKPKVLVMDEATASVDAATDAFIQETVKENFHDCTILEIAHRLHSVMDADRVIVMDQGRVVEFDEPLVLLDIEDGVFSGLVNATGETSAMYLRELATSAYKNKH